MTITTMSNRPAVKYIVRPKPEVFLWACDLCDTSIKLCVHPVEVTHRCKRTKKVSKLVQRPHGWKRVA